MKPRNILVVSAAAVFMAGSAPALAKELRLATLAPANHQLTKNILIPMQKALAARPKLNLTLKLFFSGQLGKEPDAMQQTEAGVIDMGLVGLNVLVQRVPGFNGWFTPFLFRNIDEVVAATKYKTAIKMMNSLSKTGTYGLGYGFTGLRHVIARNKAIRSVADVKGLKIRITPFPALKTFWEAMDAIPTPVSITNVYQALQTGVVDAVDSDIQGVRSLSIYEVGKNLTLTGHVPFPIQIVVSNIVFDSLTPAQQKGLREIVKAATDKGMLAVAAAERRNIAFYRKTIKVYEIKNGPVAFKAGYDAFQKKFGRDPLVKAFQAEVLAKRGK